MTVNHHPQLFGVDQASGIQAVLNSSEVAICKNLTQGWLGKLTARRVLLMRLAGLPTSGAVDTGGLAKADPRPWGTRHWRSVSMDARAEWFILSPAFRISSPPLRMLSHLAASGEEEGGDGQCSVAGTPETKEASRWGAEVP